MTMIRQFKERDFETIIEIINDAAQLYKGIIPEDRWNEPYMSFEELKNEIEDGVEFYVLEKNKKTLGIMGIQDRGDVSLIRHAYVRTRDQKLGIGTELLQHLERKTNKPILIGTWAAAFWAISFYKKNGYSLLAEKDKDHFLKKYWSIPKRQIETSVVLAKGLIDKPN